MVLEFYTTLYTDFSTLKVSDPSLFPSGGTDPADIQYAIWNFDSMLTNE